MYTKPRYKLIDVIWWTRFETILFFINASIPTILFVFLDWQWLQIPWTAEALIGTAVAFMIGFQNNAAYGRIWEARKIWGGIVNTTRTWANFTWNLIDHQDQEAYKQLLYRHISWLTSLRYEMRKRKPWETFQIQRVNNKWNKLMFVPEKKSAQDEQLKTLLSNEEYSFIDKKQNRPSMILYKQSSHLKKLKEAGQIDSYSFVKLQSLIEEFLTLQGKSERIKNFPYPRQYATIGYLLTWIFILLLPYALLPKFIEMSQKLDAIHAVGAKHLVWTTIPFVMLVSWTFHTMEKIGRAGENPFEGTANDIPISSIARTLEIEMRQILNEENIPDPFPSSNNVQM